MGLVDDWLKQGHQVAGEKTAIALAADPRSPDELAEYDKISRKLGVPAIAVGSDPAAFKARLAQREIAADLADAPKTAAWLLNRDNGGLAKDDVETLSWFEKVLRLPGEGFIAAADDINQSSGGRAVQRGLKRVEAIGPTMTAFDAANRLANSGLTLDEMIAEEIARVGGERANPGAKVMAMQVAKMRFDGAARLGDKQDILASGAAAFRSAQILRDQGAAIPQSETTKAFIEGPLARSDKSLLGFFKAVATDPIGGAALIAETAAESLPLLLGSAAVTAATRNPTFGIAAMTGGSYLMESTSSAMDLLTERGADISTPEAAMAVLQDADLMAEARSRGVTRGLVVALFDAVSGGVAGKTLMKTTGGEMVVQGIAQTLFGAGGEGAAQYASGQDINWNEIAIEGLAELVTAPVEVGGVAGRALVQKYSKAATAGTTAETLAQVDDVAGASKLKARDPAKLEEFIQTVKPDGYVYVPAESLNTFFQAKDTTFDPTDWGVDVAAFEEAIASGGNIAVPLSKYAAKISGTDDAAWFKENATLEPDEMSLAEAADFNAQSREIMDKALAEIDQMRVAEMETRAAELQVRDELYSQLRAAGRSRDVADNEARVAASIMTSLAERDGSGDSLDLARRFGLDIRGLQSEPMRRRGDMDIALNQIRSGKYRKPGSSLSEFVANNGGLSDVGGDVEAIQGPKGLIAETRAQVLERKSQPSLLGMPSEGKGKGLDEMGRAAVVAGYFPDLSGQNADPEVNVANILLDALREEAAGRRLYVLGTEGDTAVEDLADELSRRAIDPGKMTNDEIAKMLEGDRLNQAVDPFTVEGARDAEIEVDADDGGKVVMKAGEVEAILNERISDAQALLRCMNG